MIDRYSRKELRSIWADENKYKIWLDIELAAAEAMEKLNIIPKGVVKKVRSKARINVSTKYDSFGATNKVGSVYSGKIKSNTSFI